jgi:DNA mismatch endonuclease, patch repair protein
MRQIRSRDTSPEMIVRRLLHGMGYRYRLHVAALPGKPDLVFPRWRRIVEVRGCFWHQHPGCIDSHIPKTRQEYWGPKLERNRARDEENASQLRRLGWRLCVVWDCETKKPGRLAKRLVRWFGA